MESRSIPEALFWGGFGFGGVTLDEMSEPMKQPKQDTLRGFGIWGNGDVGSHRICISFLLPIQDNKTTRQQDIKTNKKRGIVGVAEA